MSGITWTMPAEAAPHARTFMAWPTVRSDWFELLGAVRQDIVRLARAIAQYEPVVLAADPADAVEAARACGSTVDVVPVPVDNLWARDILPKFVIGGGVVAGVDFNFNGWGDEPGVNYERDARAAAALLAHFGMERLTAPLVSDGGGFETDGCGTMLMTESAIVNDNRNPGRSRDEIERVVKRQLGQHKVIWFDGVKGADITDAHVDSLARFVAPGTVILDVPARNQPPDVWSRVSDQARSVLAAATDASGRPFTVVELPEADPYETRATGDDFLAGYVNFYVANGSVFLPQFGDRRADDRAAGVLREQFPGRDVVQLDIDSLAQGGGGIHCATQEQPALP